MNRVGTLTVGMHHFQTYPRHGGRDGANFAYAEIVRLLRETRDIAVRSHDIRALAADDDAARRALAPCDVVVATVGPHSYMYFYLRERLKLNYRIVRDVRTALWNGYLLQEVLVAPYLRADDLVIYSTAYSRDLFRAVVPVAPHRAQHVCYPLMHWFPSPPPRPAADFRRNRPTVIGYVGRLTTDKNFPQALDLIAALERRRPGEFRLCAVGEGTPPFGTRDAKQRLGRALGAYEWVPPVGRDAVWSFYKKLDLLFFPSTSTLETFGRVLVEATYAGVPVLAAGHGAAHELLDQDALMRVTYDQDRSFPTHFAAPLGTIDIGEAATRLIEGPPVPPSHPHKAYCNDAERFVDLVMRGADASITSRRESTPEQNSFIRRIQMKDLVPMRSIADADKVITTLRARFASLHTRGPSCAWALIELLVRSRHRQKTIQFVKRKIRQGEDFTNVGGIDLEFSHLIRFYPAFNIDSESSACSRAPRASATGASSNE